MKSVASYNQERLFLLSLLVLGSVPHLSVVTAFGVDGSSSQKIPWHYYRLPQTTATKNASPSSSSVSKQAGSSSSRRKSLDDEILKMEQEVMQSVREKRDFEQVARALRDEDDLKDSIGGKLVPASKPSILAPADPSKATNAQQHQLQVALASTFVTAAASFFLFSNVFISAILSIIVFVSANNDPIDNNSNDGVIIDDDNLLGAVARMVGRTTLQSYQQTTPKVKAVARAVVTGEKEMKQLRERLDKLEYEEMPALYNRIQELEQEKAQLELWKFQRERVDDNLNRFKLTELKQVARDYGLPVGGTKAEVLLRLVQSGAIDLGSPTP